jgi:hypothetical protein
MQCIASYLFIYFSCLTPIITFGGLLGDATENRIAAIESLMSGKNVFLHTETIAADHFQNPVSRRKDLSLRSDFKLKCRNLN